MASSTQIDLGALNQRVTSLESAIQGVSAQLGALSSKIDERSRTPWATMISGGILMMTVMSAVGILAYRPIDQEQTRIAYDIRDIKREVSAEFRSIRDQTVPRDVIVDLRNEVKDLKARVYSNGRHPQFP